MNKQSINLVEIKLSVESDYLLLIKTASKKLFMYAFTACACFEPRWTMFVQFLIILSQHKGDCLYRHLRDATPFNGNGYFHDLSHFTCHGITRTWTRIFDFHSRMLSRHWYTNAFMGDFYAASASVYNFLGQESRLTDNAVVLLRSGKIDVRVAYARNG